MAHIDRISVAFRIMDLISGLMFGILAVNGARCPDRWHVYEKTQICLFLSNDTANWQLARAICQMNGGDLTTIEDPDKHSFFNDLVAVQPKDYWLGLHDRGTDGVFRWLNNTFEATYVNWTQEEPDNTDTEDCAYVFPRGMLYTWNVSSCTEVREYTCQTPAINDTASLTTVEPLSCPEGWHLYTPGKTCFFTSTQYTDWHAARRVCQEMGGDLPVIPDLETNVFFGDLVRQQSQISWIGLNDHGQEGTFYWLDDDNPASYFNWTSGEPASTTHEDCVLARPNDLGRWETRSCSRTAAVSCQKTATSRASVVPSKCPAGWHFYRKTNSCFNISEIQDSWDNSRAHCQLAGGDLAIIRDFDTFLFVEGISKTRRADLWIGLRYHKNEENLYWLDESLPASFLSLVRHHPGMYGHVDCFFAGYPDRRWYDANCRTSKIFSCEKLASNTTTIIHTTTEPTGPCPPGWHYNKNDKTCYEFSKAQLSWYGARSFCEYQGGHLAIIDNPDTEEFIRGLTAGRQEARYWVGLHDTGVEGIYHWLDNVVKASYPTLTNNQTDSHDEKDCVIIEYSQSLPWDVEQCYKSSHFLCQMPSNGTPLPRPMVPTPKPSEACLSGWTYQEKSHTCYMLSTLAATWYNSRTLCGQLGGDLAVIKDPNVQITINDMIKHQPGQYWIGLNDQSTGRFVWRDEASTADFVWWAPGEPSMVAGDKCAFIQETMRWQSSACSSNRLFICEREAAELPDVMRPMPGSCPEDWYYYPQGEMCYGLFNDKETWYQARRVCQGYSHGDLTVIKDAETHIFLNGILDRKLDEYWIGLRDEYDAFRWVGDNMTADYFWWQLGEPNNERGRTDCVHTSRTWPFRWQDDSCGIQLAFSCQASPIANVHTSTSLTSTPTSIPTSAPLRESDGHSNGLLVGVVIASLIVGVIIGAVTIFILKRRCKSVSRNKRASLSSDCFDNISYNKSDVNLNFPNKT